MLSVISAVLIGFITVLFYFWTKRTYNYWNRKGVTQVNPIPIFGNTLSLFTFRKSLGNFYQELYEKYKNEKLVGIYETTNPVLLVRDPKLIENILVKDFSHFVNRDTWGSDSMQEVDFGIQILKDSEWRGVRYKLIPAFSSGKLKLMFQYMTNCAQSILDNLERSHKNVDIKEISTQYALDVIATCAFGIDVTKDVNKNSELRNMGKEIFHLNTLGYLCFLLFNTNNKVASWFGIKLTSGKVGEYFGKIIKDTMRNREATGFRRNDFIDLLLQLKNKGTIEVQSKVDPEDNYLQMDYEPAPETFSITESIVISQAYVFLTAGFDGLSGPMTLLLYELAKNQPIQDKVRLDIEEMMSKYGGLTYEALKSCKYLDCCINEGLRIYPLVKMIQRVCTKEYEIQPGVKLDPGTKIVFSIGGLQVDPKYYKDSLVFNPDRFVGEITHNVTDFTFLPFGAGPRMCIGMRFAQLTMKMALATILTNYRILPNSKTPSKLNMRIKTFFINQPETLITFDVKKIK